MIRRFIRKNKENFYGGEMIGEISNEDMKDMIEGMLLSTEHDNVKELDDICMVVFDYVKKEARFLKKFYTVEIKYKKVFEDVKKAEEYRDKYDGTLRCFTNELRDKRKERIDDNFDFTIY